MPFRFGTRRSLGLGAAGGAARTVTTWNPADKSPNIILSGGNLSASNNTGTERTVRATQTQRPGAKGMYEAQVGNRASIIRIGFSDLGPALSTYVGAGVWSISYGSNGQILRDGITQGTVAAYGGGSNIQCVFDDAASTVSFYNNGNLQGTYTVTSGVGYYPACSLAGDGSSPDVVVGRFNTASIATPIAGTVPWD